MVRDTVGRVLTVLLIVVFLSLTLGQVLGQPVGLAYVDSGSMEPAMDVGDGFIAIPAAITPDPQEGDVITFEAEELEGGGLTTHRVIGETPEGYITRGDANPFTDQDGGEPPVTDEQIVAEALQIGDTVVTIPHFGTVVEGTQEILIALITPIASAIGLGAGVTPGTIGLGIFALGFGLFVWSIVTGRESGPARDLRRKTEPDERLDTTKIAVVVLLIVLIPANASMVLVGGPTDITIDGDEVAEAGDVAPGETIESEFDIANSGLLTMVFVLEADGDVTLGDDALTVPPGEEVTTTLSVPAPPPGEERTITIDQHRYFVLFPEGLLLSLHEISPLAALGALNAFVTVSILGFIGGLFGFGEVQFRQTSRDVPLSVVLKRRLRR